MTTAAKFGGAAAARAMATHAADRLWHAICRAGGPVCVGLDPVGERLPNALKPSINSIEDVVAGIERFSIGVIDAVANVVPCVKVQAACFERYGALGFAAMERVVEHGRSSGLVVILDAKRGDMDVSAAHYAAMAFDRVGADWLTVHGYLGKDSLQPFFKPGHGVFVLVRTSNPGGDALQTQRLASGGDVADAMGAMVEDLGAASVASCGYSCVGAVVGATKPTDAARLRRLMPRTFFLVPGYGAQGAGVTDVVPCFHSNGRGAIVSASRSVIYAFQPSDREWQNGVQRAAVAFRDEVAKGVQWSEHANEGAS